MRLVSPAARGIGLICPPKSHDPVDQIHWYSDPLPFANNEVCGMRKWRGPSPFGHIAASAAAFASRWRSRGGL